MAIALYLFGLTCMAALWSSIPSLNHKAKSKSTQIHYAPDPACVLVRKRKDSQEVEKVSLRSLVENRCKSLLSEFRPLWWLFNGHLQTIYCVLGDFSKIDRMSYNRKYLRLLEGGTIGLDFAPVDDAGIPDDAPIIVVQHGLTGGSYEAYIRAILVPACKPREDGGLGFRAVVVNFRGCAGVPLTSPQFYSAGYTDDLRQALIYITKLYPRAPLLGLGYSLGANVMTRYLAEEGENSRLVSGCALACPWDLAKNASGLSTSVLGRQVYSKGMGGNLVNVVKRHAKTLLNYPDHQVAKAVPVVLALKNPTLEQFDETFTRIAGGSAPHFPFPTAQDYYHWASSHLVVKDLRVPFLAINSADDPVVQHVPMDGGGNGLVVMALTPSGGHLGWFQAAPVLGHVERWIKNPVLEWLELVGEGIVHDDAPRGRPIYVDQDGFLKEEGRDDLGCKEIQGPGVIDGNEGEEGLLQGL